MNDSLTERALGLVVSAGQFVLRGGVLERLDADGAGRQSWMNMGRGDECLKRERKQRSPGNELPARPPAPNPAAFDHCFLHLPRDGPLQTESYSRYR